MAVAKIAADAIVSDARPLNGHEDPDQIEKQTRTRKLFTPLQLFCFSFMYFGTWLGMGTNMYFGLVNGGPAAFLFNFIIVSIGVLAQAACLAELASILPVAGAQYYWTWQFTVPRYKLFLTWIQGWVTWLGYVATLASSLNNAVYMIESTVQINYPDYPAGGWRTTVIVIAVLVIFTVLNLWFFRTVPFIELLSGILCLAFFVITLVTLLVMSPKNDASYFLTTANTAGWSDFISWNVGMLTQIWQFIGFESVTHMGEEAKHASRSVPQALFWSVAANMLTGLIMVVVYILCMPPIDDIVNADNPFVYLVVTSTGSLPIGTMLAAGVAAVNALCSLSVFSSTSRITWAWARDGGLPSWFGHVSSKTRVPERAVLLTCILVALLSLLNIGSDTYVALGAITSLSSLALYFSYAIILSVTLHTRFTTGLRASDWSMGFLGTPMNIFALIYTIYTMIWLPFPTSVPVTVDSMNYCGPVFLAVLLGALGGWFIWGSKHWLGPNKGVARVVLEKAAQE